MGPLLARVVFLAFVCLAIGITINALYLQQGPLPKSQTASKPKIIPDRVNKKRNLATGSTDTKKTKAESESKPPLKTLKSVDLVRAIQRELKTKGYEPGRVNGVAGLETRAAIMAFEFDKNLQVTAQPSQQLLKHILLGSSPSSKPTKNKTDYSADAKNVVMAVQRVLADLGYSPGEIDGVYGNSTRRAIGDFERDRGLPVKGRVSGKLIQEIARITDMPVDAAG